jgi:hypothetical protein
MIRFAKMHASFFSALFKRESHLTFAVLVGEKNFLFWSSCFSLLMQEDDTSTPEPGDSPIRTQPTSAGGAAPIPMPAPAGEGGEADETTNLKQNAKQKYGADGEGTPSES